MARSSRGFTLIELMIVVAIVAIIMAFAIPSFQESVAKSRRTEAMSSLQQLQLRQESFRTMNAAYATQAQYIAQFGALPTNDYYAFTIPASGASSYTLTATPQAGQSGDRCGNLSLVYNNGVTTKSSSTGAGRCWD